MHVLAPAILARRGADDVAAGGPVLADRNLERDGPAAAGDRALIRRIAPLAFEAVAREHGFGVEAVADDLHGMARVGADAEPQHFARCMERLVGIAPDADLAAGGARKGRSA